MVNSGGPFADTRADEVRRRLSENRLAVVRIRGSSMSPTLRPGATVRLEPCTSMRVGDVVTYELGKLMFTHRVVKLQGDTVVCRGDNHLRNDPPVPVSDVLGRAVETVGGGLRLQSPVITTFVRSRWVVRSLALRGRHVRDEMQLLVHGIRGREIEAGGLSVLGLPDGSETPSATMISDVSSSVFTNVAPSGEIPAGVFSRLPRGRRLALLREVAGHPVTVFALPRARQGRVERMFTRLRTWLRRSGVPAGDPGDNAVPEGVGLPPGYVHYFTIEEFSAELSAMFREGRVSVREIDSSTGPLLLGDVRPS
jgi:hypothetical protein